MKKLLQIFIMCFFFTCELTAQITFERTYGGDDSYVCHSVEQASDGGYLAAGYINHLTTNKFDLYVMKTNAYGDTLWTHSYNTPDNDFCYDMQITQDQGCIITGYTGSYPAFKVLLIKTDVNGDALWTQTYGVISGVDTIGYFGRSVQQTSDGGYIVTGYTSNPDYTNDIFLLKTNASGEILWTKVYNKDEGDIGNAVRQTPDGGFIIAGKTSYMWFTYVYLIKTDAVGDTLWTRTYGDSESQEASDIQLLSDGGYVISGNILDENYYTNDVYLLKTDASGQIIWSKAFGGIYDEFSNSICQTSDGGFVIVGQTVNYPIINIYLVKTNLDGDTLWTRTYGGEEMEEYGYSVNQTTDGGYIIGGYTFSQATSMNKIYLVKTNGDGQTVGIDDYRSLSCPITISPNPASSFVNIQSVLNMNGLKVYNHLGQILASTAINGKFYRFDSSYLKAGMYFFSIETDEYTVTRRILIE